MVDKELLEILGELSESDLRRLQFLIDNKLNEKVDRKKVSYRKKNIKCGKESCQSCPHGPYWYAEWSVDGVRKSKYLGKNIDSNAK
mgnify:FL=1